MSFTEFPIPSVNLSDVAPNARSAINAMENSNDAVNNAIESDSAATIASLDTGGSLWSWIVGKIGAITSIAAGGAWSFGGKVLVGTAQATSGKLTVTNNNSDDAVRITQTGSGNALVVEDFTNPDGTPFVINGEGTVIAGASTAYSPTGLSFNLQNHQVNSVNQGAGFYNWSTAGSSTGGRISLLRSNSTTIGTYTAASPFAQYGQIDFWGSDGTKFVEAARIIAYPDGTPGADDMPGRLVFSTTADGAATPSERMRINSAGNVGIGRTIPAAKLDVLASASSTEPSLRVAHSGSGDALRVTQTGSGNALVVEDSTTQDSTPFVIRNDGKVIIGRTSLLEPANTGVALIQTHSTGGSGSGYSMFNWDSSTGNSGNFRLFKSISGVIGSNQAATQNTDLGTIQFLGDDGGTFFRAAQIGASVDGVVGQLATSLVSGAEYRILSVGTTDFTTFGAADNNVGTVFTANRTAVPEDGDGIAVKTNGDMPGRLVFLTTSNGVGYPTERMRINSSGNIGIGTQTPSSRLHVAGDLTLSSATTSTSATAGTNGDVPAQVAGYLTVSINGTARKIPYYA